MNHDGTPPQDGRSLHTPAPFYPGYRVTVVDGYWKGRSGEVLRRIGDDTDQYLLRFDGGLETSVRRSWLAPDAGVVHGSIEPRNPERPDVTLDDLRSLAEYLRAHGKGFAAKEVDRCADELQAKQDPATEKETRAVRLIDHLGKAYREGERKRNPSYSPYDQASDLTRENIREGLRSVLQALAKLDTYSAEARREFTLDAVVEEFTEAIRLSVEYVGVETLPPVRGWSWYDAMRKYAPDKARRLVEEYERIEAEKELQRDVEMRGAGQTTAGPGPTVTNDAEVIPAPKNIYGIRPGDSVVAQGYGGDEANLNGLTGVVRQIGSGFAEVQPFEAEKGIYVLDIRHLRPTAYRVPDRESTVLAALATPDSPERTRVLNAIAEVVASVTEGKGWTRPIHSIRYGIAERSLDAVLRIVAGSN